MWDAPALDDRWRRLYVPGSPFTSWRSAARRLHVHDPNPAAPGDHHAAADGRPELRPRTTQTVNSDAWRYVYSKKTERPGRPGDETRLQHHVRTTRRRRLVLRHRRPLPGEQQPDHRTGDGDRPVERDRAWAADHEPFATSLGRLRHEPDEHVAARIGGMCWHRNRSRASAGCTAVHGRRQRLLALRALGPTRRTRRRQPRPRSIPAPAADFAAWYALGEPRPDDAVRSDRLDGHVRRRSTTTPCGNGGARRATSRRRTGYYCWTPQGTLDWDAAAQTLEVEGTIYYDGDADFSTTTATIDYDGIGAHLPVRLVPHAPDRALRQHVRDGTATRQLGPHRPDAARHRRGRHRHCPRRAATAGSRSSSRAFQGALYATTNIEVSQNSNTVQGPMVAAAGDHPEHRHFTDFPMLRRACRSGRRAT